MVCFWKRVVRCFVFAGRVTLAGAVVVLGSGPAVAEELYSRFISPTPPLSPAEQQAKFHLPPGFEIQLVAAEPEIRKPINLKFDAKGRLFVTGSIEYPFPATDKVRPRDVLWMLSDADGDGRYDRVSTFAEELNIPVGVTPIVRGLLVFTIPHVAWLRDENGDGRADERRVLYGPFGYTDTQGMPNGFTWWLDGWVYACQGQDNVSPVVTARGDSLTMRGGTTFRMRPDGSRIEPFAQGQVNPFGLCFDPWGNVYTADSNSRPGSLLLPGGSYPALIASESGLGFAPTIMNHFHGSTGIAGIVYYAADDFPAEYRDTLYIGNPVTGKINHDHVERTGSGCRAIELPDFLSCDDPWFRPVDLQLGPDGALYIADFYNKIIAHVQVPLEHSQRDRERGRIWRVVYTGSGTKAGRPPGIPNLERATCDELIETLRDPNLTLRVQATHQLVERVGASAIGPLTRLLSGASHPRQRAHGLWVLFRLNSLDEVLVRRLAADPDVGVRVHALRAVSEWPGGASGDSDVVRVALERLDDPDALVKRVAAEALAAHPSDQHVEPLLRLWADAPPTDGMLVYSIRRALRNCILASEDLVRIAAPYSARADVQRRLAEVSLSIARADAAEFLVEHLRSGAFDPVRLEELLHHAARNAEPGLLAAAYEMARAWKAKDLVAQAEVLRALFRAAEERGAALPPDIARWSVDLTRRLLTSKQERQVFDGLELAWDLKLSEVSDLLGGFARDKSQDPSIRSFAIDAFAAVDGLNALDSLDKLLIDSTESLDIRAKAADAMGKINDERCRVLLGQRLKEVPTLVALAMARALTHNRAGAEVLLSVVKEGRADARLLQDSVVEQHLPMLQIPDLEVRLKTLLAGLPSVDERMGQMIAARRAGFLAGKKSPERGKQTFEKNCAICHQVLGQGAKVGPALDGIGLRGLDRLLEDTLIPSQNVQESYRSSVVVLDSGRIVTGLATAEDGTSVTMVDSEGRSQRIPQREIEERQLSKTSPMPANVAEKIPEADYYDLLAYLLGI